MQRRELLQRVVARAREDAAFRAAVEADPRGTVERELGVSLPAELDVEGIRDRVRSRFGATPTELNDMELDGVVGGYADACVSCEHGKG